MTEYSGTALRILDAAQELIQCSGYNAISFNDIAQQVGIKKPSIIHHFPSKAALGRAAVQRYQRVFANSLDEVLQQKNQTAMDAFEHYCAPYVDFGDAQNKICLCGALAGEFSALPEEIQKEVSSFFAMHLNWLEKILHTGLEQGVFHFSATPASMAQHILDSLQGSLLVKRTTSDDKHVHDTIAILKSLLQGKAAKV